MRLIFQRDLLRIQLFLEDRTNFPEHLESRIVRQFEILLVEGGCLSIIFYLLTTGFDAFRDLFGIYGVFGYGCIDGVLYIFLHSLVETPMLMPLFEDGRRLDGPLHAKQLSRRLSRLPSADPRHQCLSAKNPAEYTPKELASIVENSLINIFNYYPDQLGRQRYVWPSMFLQ